MKTDAQQAFEKDYTALKSYLLGRDYKDALRCMPYALERHNGFRKDGVTPEFHHQVRICFSILNLRGVRNEELAICLGFLHDTPEDKHVSHHDLAKEFNETIAVKACRLNKHAFETEDECMKAIAGDPDCSVVKGADNKDNIGSMVGVFSFEKMTSYIERTRASILPMLKDASHAFPDQSYAYASLRSTLKDQVRIYDWMVNNQESFKHRYTNKL